MMFSFSELKKIVSTHSRPKAAGIGSVAEPRISGVSTHSRPKAAGISPDTAWEAYQFQHTAARRRLEKTGITHITTITFQHTAARRRLVRDGHQCLTRARFQHTAARRRLVSLFTRGYQIALSFNTQPPEGGWFVELEEPVEPTVVSTHSRPKAAGETT